METFPYHMECELLTGDFDRGANLSDANRDPLFISLEDNDDDDDDDDDEEEEDAVGCTNISASAAETSLRLLPLTVVLAVQFRKELSVASSVGDGISSAPSFDSIKEVAVLSHLFIMNGVIDIWICERSSVVIVRS